MSPGLRLRLTRGTVVAAGLALWFWTQSLIGSRPPATGAHGIGDAVHAWTAPWNAWLEAHPGAADVLLIVSSACIDGLSLFLIAVAIFGRSIRPFLGLMLVFALRQLNQGLTSVTPPDGMIWRHPGFPSLLVTYDVSNDMFFSGHTALAVFGALELGRAGGPGLKALALGLAVFEMLTVLVLRAHYTMDVYAGAITALLVGLLASSIAKPADRGRRGIEA